MSSCRVYINKLSTISVVQDELQKIHDKTFYRLRESKLFRAHTVGDTQYHFLPPAGTPKYAEARNFIDKVNSDSHFPLVSTAFTKANQKEYVYVNVKNYTPLIEDAYKREQYEKDNNLGDTVSYQIEDKGSIFLQAATLNDVSEVNIQFNKDLDRFIEGTLSEDFIFKLGFPTIYLQKAGFPDLPIELRADLLSDTTEFQNHKFNSIFLRNLPKYLNYPIAVFRNKDHNGNLSVLTEAQDENGVNILVAVKLDLLKNKPNGDRYRISDIRSIYPKNSIKGIVNWFVNDEMTFRNKKRAISWISKQQSNPAEVTKKDIALVTKIIENFNNPVPDEYILYQDSQVNKPLTSSKASAETLKKVKEFLLRIGVTTNEVNEIIVDGQKIGANGVADALNKLIQVVEGKEDVALTEEAMHIAVAIIKKNNPALYRKMLSSVHKYGLYQQTHDIYSKIYLKDSKPDIPKIKEEALAKILAEYVILENEGSLEKPELIEAGLKWWQEILAILKDLFGKVGFDPFAETAQAILAGEEQRIFTNNLVTLEELERNKEFQGTLVEFVEEIASDRDIPVAFRNINKGEKFLFVKDLFIKKYNDKAWTKSAVQSDNSKSTPLLENQFSSLEEFLTFALLHEKAHEYIFKKEDETIGAYGDRINKEALNKLNSVEDDGIFLQATPQDELLQQFAETSERIVNVPVEGKEGDNQYIDKKNNDEVIVNRVSKLAKERANKFKDAPSLAIENKGEYAKKFGRAGHSDIEFLLKSYIKEDKTVEYFIDEDGNRKPVKQDTSTYISKLASMHPNGYRQQIYDTLERYVTDLLSSYPEGTKFTLEQTLFDESKQYKNDKGEIDKGLVGTTDFIALLPTGQVDVLDWKFFNLNKDQYKDVQYYNQESWRAQMSLYKGVLMDAYGIKQKDFRRTQMIPILLNYGSFGDVMVEKDGKKYQLTEYFPESIEVAGTLTTDTADYLIPVPDMKQSSGDSKIDELIEKLRAAFDKLNNAPAEDRDKAAKSLKLNTLQKSIRHLQVFKNTVPLLEDIKLALLDADNLLKEDINAIENKEVFAARIIAKRSSLEDFKGAYFDLKHHLPEELLKEFSKAELDITEKIAEIDKLNQAFVDKIANEEGVEGILKEEKQINAGGFIQGASFSKLSEHATSALQTLSKLVSRAENKIDFAMNKVISELQDLQKSIAEDCKRLGMTQLELLNLVRQKNEKGEHLVKLIDEYDSKFYKELKEQIDNLNSQTSEVHETAVAWIGKNVDLKEYVKFMEVHRKEQLEIIEETTYSADDITNELIKQEEREKLMKMTDPTKKESLTNYRYIKNYPTSTWKSKEYLKVESIPAALKLYNHFKKANEHALKVGYLTAGQVRTFMPTLDKSLLEKWNLDGQYSALDAILSSITIDENIGEYGKYDESIGQFVDGIPTPFKKEKDNPTAASDELLKNLAAYQRAVINFEHKSDIESTVHAIYLVEKSKKSLKTSNTNKIVKRKNKDLQGNEVPEFDNDNKKNADLFWAYVRQTLYSQKYSLSDADIVFGSPAAMFNVLIKQINKIPGIDIKPLKEDGRKLSLARLLEATSRAFTVKTMGLNIFTAASVYIGGNIHLAINSGRYHTRRDLTLAAWGQASSSMIKNAPLTIALMKQFMPVDSALMRQANSLNISKVDAAGFADLMMVLLRSADEAVQYENFRAFMANTIVLEGKIYNAREYYRNSPAYQARYKLPQSERLILEKNFENEVQKLIKENGLEKHATVDAKGNLVIAGIDNLQNDNIFQYRDLMRAVAQEATGNISPDDETAIRLSVIYRSALLFKNWVPSMVRQRFGGINYSTKKQSYSWGRANMMVNFLATEGLKTLWNLKDVVTATDKGVALMESYYEKTKLAYEKRTGKELKMTQAEMNDMLRRNVKNMLKEAIILTSLVGLIVAAAAAAPDDDEDQRTKNIYKLSYRMLDKIQQELSFYYNPMAMQTMLSGGTLPALGLITDAIKVLGSIIEQSTGFITGSEKIQESANPLKNTLKALPITSQLVQFLPVFAPDLAKELNIQISNKSRVR